MTERAHLTSAPCRFPLHRRSLIVFWAIWLPLSLLDTVVPLKSSFVQDGVRYGAPVFGFPIPYRTFAFGWSESPVNQQKSVRTGNIAVATFSRTWVDGWLHDFWMGPYLLNVILRLAFVGWLVWLYERKRRKKGGTEGEKRYPPFQLRLSTALIILLAAAVLLYLNVVPARQAFEDGGFSVRNWGWPFHFRNLGEWHETGLTDISFRWNRLLWNVQLALLSLTLLLVGVERIHERIRNQPIRCKGIG